MGLISGILSILGSSAIGSILGGVFALLNKKSDLEVKRMELEHELQKWAHDLELRSADREFAILETQGKKDVAIIEGDSSVEVARMKAIAEAQESDKISADEVKAAGKWGWMLVVGMAMRAWVRPLATVVLTGAAVYLNWMLIGKLTESWDTLTIDQRYESAMQAFAWITGQAAATLSYWFLSRGPSRG